MSSCRVRWLRTSVNLSNKGYVHSEGPGLGVLGVFPKPGQQLTDYFLCLNIQTLLLHLQSLATPSRCCHSNIFLLLKNGNSSDAVYKVLNHFSGEDLDDNLTKDYPSECQRIWDLTHYIQLDISLSGHPNTVLLLPFLELWCRLLGNWHTKKTTPPVYGWLTPLGWRCMFICQAWSHSSVCVYSGLFVQDVVAASGFTVGKSPTHLRDKLHPFNLRLSGDHACVFVRH